ncbi:hypothetical protein IW261DRAFT_1111101 [Armillaria novae-zelandiae]|uniref:Uncharacterized protein n=1 Tax=Armillaria novae-zelandiae TaxID=153914 RepID=A0AA39TYB7_9AGAR|nr:hypothetical protein IW261DRAFT_1111101 [Armillaria novae-zelandiae]
MSLLDGQHAPSVNLMIVQRLSFGTTVSSTTTTTQDSEIESSPYTSPIYSSTTPSSHKILIIGSVLGVIAFILLLLILAFLFQRRCKRQRNNTNRVSQILLEPYCQEKVPSITTPSQTSRCQDEPEVLRDRARLGELEETVQILVNNQRRYSIRQSETDPQPPPDYASASSGADGFLHVSSIA